ncbi:sulfatase-like hydrolase/transferase [Novosphingobium aquae]|uniref:Sulfatase-like hydrolase/transferase n=1 Tax=Novosphingobium aquae TaxID=3133435 RepID=A0ABU8SA42_9SPHN
MRKSRIALLSLALSVVAASGWALWAANWSSLPVDRQGPLPSAAPSRTEGPPNIVLIVADDLGYGGVSSYGGNRFTTPQIDALASSGVRYTNAHVTASVCSPSRAGLLTGRNGVSFGFEFNPGDQQDEASKAWGLPLNVPTLAERLRQQGYATAAIGKWHLGGAPGMRPTERGFDEFFGVLEGAFNYFSVAPEGADASGIFRLINGPDRRVTPFLRGNAKVRVDEYATDRFTYEGRSFIRRQANRPFFLYMAYNAPHSPFEAPRKYLDRFPKLKGVERTFAGMMAGLDDGVGALMAELRARGLDRNTLVIFMSDNGCPNYPIQDGRLVCSNAPLAGTKASLFEGGLRVPMIVSGPGFATAVNNNPVSSLDITPTVLRLAGAAVPASLEGVDLQASLRPEAANRRLFWRSGQSVASLHGKYKLHIAERADPKAKDSSGDNPLARIRRKLAGEEDRVRARTMTVYGQGKPEWGYHSMLYDIDSDAGETRNLVPTDPKKFAEMKAELEKWNATLPKRPNWGSDLDAISEHEGVNLLRH